MLTKSREQIKDVFSLASQASSFHARLLRMGPKENGETRIENQVLDAFAKAAIGLGVVNPSSYSAQGVVFLQRKDEILSGQRPLKQIEAESFIGYVARQARKQINSRFNF